jgi:ATP-binding cassette subfamily C protein
MRCVKTPTLLQMEAVECGAASLGIILAYYGRIVPLATLWEECGVSRDGTNAWNLLQVAQRYGLKGNGLKASIEQLKTLRLPYIIFWNFNHFLVVEGLGKNRVYLNDPESGKRTVSMEEFDRSYTGIVLVMEPGKEFQRGGKKRHTIASLISRLHSSWAAVIFCFLAGLLLTFPRLAVPVFSQVFVDEILVQNRYNWIRPLLIGMVITAILRWLLASLRLVYLRRLMVKLSVTMSAYFFRHALNLPIAFYVQRYAGEISNRLLLNERVAEVLSGRLALTVIDAVMMLIYWLIMMQYSIHLSLVVAGFAAINFVALSVLAGVHKDTNIQLGQAQGKVAGVTVSSIQAIETIKASGLEADVFSRFAGHYANVVNFEQKLGWQTQLLGALPTLLNALSNAGILTLMKF